jgi:hypothetical protein
MLLQKNGRKRGEVFPLPAETKKGGNMFLVLFIQRFDCHTEAVDGVKLMLPVKKFHVASRI